jgi:DNA transformation protein and related proteins
MKKLTELPNIGATLAERLKKADIKTAPELKELGSEKAFIRMGAIYDDLCINMLYALEGAVQGIRWHGLPDERKKELAHFFNMLKK